MTEQVVTLRLKTDASGVRPGIVAVSAELDKVGRSGQQAGNQVQAAMAKGSAGAAQMARSAAAASMSIKDVVRQAAALAGIALGVGFVRQLAQMADGYTNLTSKIRNVTDSEESLARVRQATFGIAQQTRQEFSATAELCTRLTRATADLGLAESQRLRITETINKAMVVSGATAQESAAAIIQLSQGLAAGALRGEEFNSVAEQAPILMDLLGKSLGMTRDELRAYAAEGKITAEVVTKALLEGGAAVDAQFGNMALTIGGASQQLSNAALKWVGEANTSVGASAALAAGLSGLASNFSTLANGVAALAAVVGVRLVASLVASVSATAAKAAQDIAASIAAEKLAIATAQAAVAQTTGAQAAVAAALAQTEAALATARAGVAEAQAAALASKAHLSAAQSAGALSFALAQQKVALDALAIARTREAALATEVGVLVRAETFARASLVGATEAHALASSQLVAAQAAQVGIMGRLASVGSGLFALMGGWAGVVVALVAGLAYLASRATDTSTELERLGVQTQSAREKTLSLADALSILTTGAERATKSLADIKQAQLDAVNAAIEQRTAAEVVFFALARMSGGMDEAKSVSALLTGEIEKLRQAEAQFGAANLLADWSDKARAALTAVNTVIQQTINWRDTLAGQSKAGAADAAKEAAELTKQARAIGATRAQIEQLTQADLIRSRAAAIHAQEGSEQYREIARLVTVERGAVLEAAKGYDAKTAAQKANTQAIKDGSKASNDAASDQRVLTKLIEDNNDAIARGTQLADELAVGMGGPLTEATRRFNKELETLAAAWVANESQMALGEITAAEYAKTQDELADGATIAGDALDAKTAAIERQRDVMGNLRRDVADEIRLAGMSADQRNVELRVIDATTEAISRRGQVYADEHAAEIRRLAESSVAAETLQSVLANVGDTSFERLVKQISLVATELERVSNKDLMGAAFDKEKVEEIQGKLNELKQQQLEGYVGALKQGISSLQSMAKEGSDAYNALGVAQSALNVITAIGGIANQANGDPYTAFGRIAAMAALMASIGAFAGSVSGAAGGFSDGAAQQQAAQGAGSVLGDAEAKSESIANAVEITADATSELVGINRGMLRALQAVQAGLSGAGGLLARGAGDQTFTNMGPAQMSGLATFTSSFSLAESLFGGLTAKIIGAKKEVTDMGIRILGGALGDLLEDISVGAYQTVSSRSWYFGSTRTNTQVKPLGDDIALQFQLVLDSIGDTVREGARALGLDMDAVNQAIAAYQIAEIKISTKGLSAEEAQAELAAVFSSIFDGLAGSIVPFVAQFQQVGEGLGETLVRVATGVQVMQEAVKQLGFSLDVTDPEQFAIASEGLIALAGGLEEFISGMSSFVSNFATDEHKFRVAQDAITRAFEQYGLTVPDTRDGMWELMQSLDATTESGREQIAMLLRLADTADAYYDELANQQERVSGLWSNYWARFHSDAERAQAALGQARTNATGDFGDIGLDVNDFMGEGGMEAFRTLFENMLPRLSEDGITQWLEAAEALGLLIDASGSMGLSVAQTAQQLAAITTILDSNAWDIAGAGMTQYQRGMRDLATEYERQRASLESNNASLAQFVALSDQYGQSVAQLHLQFRRQIDDILGGNDSTLAQAGMTDAQRQIAAINASFAAQAAQLRDLGAVQADLDRLEQQRILTLQQLADVMMQAVNDQLAGLQWDDQLAGMTGAQRELAQFGRQWDDYAAQAAANGATTEQLAVLESLRASALARLLMTQAEQAAAEQAQLDAAAGAYRDFLEGIRRDTFGVTEFQSQIRDSMDWQTQAIARAHELARAAGMAGASEQALALIELRASQMRAAAIAQLREETQSLIDQLYGAGTNLGDSLGSGIGDAASAAESFWQNQLQQIQTLNDYLDSMLFGDLSALTPDEQLAEAYRQLQDAIASGDAASATQMADAYLRLLRDAEASGADYNAGFWNVREMLQAMRDGLAGMEPPGGAGGGTGGMTGEQAEAIAARNRLELATQLAAHLGDLAGALGQSVFSLMETLGVDLRALTSDLGINLQQITGESVTALAGLAAMLGTNLETLTGELGLTLSNLGTGIAELAAGMGVDLRALTVESTAALGDLANQLGLDLTQLAGSVGVNLGSLADAQSLLNQALAGTINGLPTGTRNELEPLLAAITNATSEADANAAIDALNAAVNLLAPDIRNLLAPYLTDVFPATALSDLDYLSVINSDTSRMAQALDVVNDTLYRIAENTAAQNAASGLPSFAVGADNIPRDMVANIHRGEMIVPAMQAGIIRSRGGISVPQGGGESQAELRMLRAQVEKLTLAVEANGNKVATAVVQTGTAIDRNNTRAIEDQTRKLETTGRGNR